VHNSRAQCKIIRQEASRAAYPVSSGILLSN
jgi:hypothetical protein